MRNYILGMQCLIAFGLAIASTILFAEGDDLLSEVPMHYDSSCLKTSETDDDMACWDWTAQETNASGDIVGAKQNIYIKQGDEPKLIHARLPIGAGVQSIDSCSNRLASTGGNKARFRRDRGWRVFHREFGTEDVGEKIPNFSLYNIYDGHYMLFVYLSEVALQDGYSHGELKISLDSKQHLLSLALSTPLNTDVEIENQNLVAVDRLGKSEWFCGKFILNGYDPVTRNDGKATALSWTLTGVDITDLLADAVFNAGGDPEEEAIAETYSSDPVGAITAAYKEYGSIDESVQKAKKWIEKQYESPTKGDNKEQVKKFAKQVSDELQDSELWTAEETWGRIGAALEVAGPYVPVVAAISTFFSWSDGSADAPAMTLSGGFSLTGTLTDKDPVGGDSLSLPETGDENPLNTNVLYRKRLGTFNIWDKPTVEFVTRYLYEPCGGPEEYMKLCIDSNGNGIEVIPFIGIDGETLARGKQQYCKVTLDSFYYRLLKPLKYAVNPDAGIYMKKIGVGLALAIDKENKEEKIAVFYPLDAANRNWMKADALVRHEKFAHCSRKDSSPFIFGENFLDGLATELKVFAIISPINNPTQEARVVRTVPITTTRRKVRNMSTVERYLDARSIQDQSKRLGEHIRHNEIIATEITIPMGVNISQIPKPDEPVHLRGIERVTITGGVIRVEKGQTIIISVPDPGGDAYSCADCMS